MKCMILATIFAAAMAACPNGCSANGVCGANDKCSNKGICDRKTAECKCFDGYEGKGCRRSTCPEGCSGHGTCEYIDELAVDFEDRRTGPGFDQKTTTWTAHSNAVTQSDNTQKNNGHLYQLWDAQKIQGCKCDLGYTGPDCSSRIAPKGDDPLTTVKSVTQTQMIQISQTNNILDTEPAVSTVSWAGQTGITAAAGPNTFFIIYYDQYGGVWRTDAIIQSTDDATTAANVQRALRNLPNEVLEMVTVADRPTTSATCTRPLDGVQHIPSAEGHGTENACATGSDIATGTDAKQSDFDVTFAGKPGQTGVQFLPEVNIDYQH